MGNSDFSKLDGFQRADNILVRIYKCVSYISGASIIGIMLVAFFNVLGEKILKQGIPASTEIIQYLHIPVVFLASGFVTLDRGHINIDLLSSHFPKAVQKFVAALGFLMGAGITAFVGYRGVVQMMKFYSNNIKSSVTGVGFAKWPFALMFCVGFFMLSFSFLWSILRLYLKKPEAAAPGEMKEMEAGDGL